MKETRLTLIAVAALHAASANAQSIDQQHVASVTRGLNIDNDDPTGQSFTPTRSSLDFFRLNIGDGSFNGEGATVQLRIWAGEGFGGGLVGASTPLALPDGLHATSGRRSRFWGCGGGFQLPGRPGTEPRFGLYG